MTPENISETAAATSTTAGGEVAPAPARRRRATRTTSAPVADAATAETPAAPTTASAEGATEDVPPVKARRTRARRATTAPAAEPAATDAPAPDVAVVEPPAESAADAAPTEPVPGTEAAAPAKPARRSRRVTRTVSVPSEAETTTPAEAAPPAGTPEPVADAPAASTVAQTPAAPAEEPVEAPTKPARRRRAAGRPAAAPEAVVTAAAPAAEPAPDEEEDADETATVDDDQPLDVLAALADVRPSESAAPPAPSGPRLATTALLFQAPDPSAARPRRRRAQASAGSPQEISEAARRAEREQAEREQAEREQAEAEQAGDEQAGVAQAAAAEQGETTATESGRGSRRRGRRAGRSAASAAPEQDEAATDAQEVAPDAGAELDELLVAAGEQADPADESDELDADQGDEAGEGGGQRRRRRRGGRGRRNKAETSETDAEPGDADEDDADAQDAESDAEDGDAEDGGGSSRRRRRRRRGSRGESGESERPRRASDEVTALRGSTRLEAKRQRRREGRDAGRRRQIISEAEFLARRESVERTMVVRERAGRTQIAVLEDGVLVEHYVSNQAQTSMVGNVYLGRVQNVLPSMEAAFVDVGKGRNAVLYAGEVNWDAAGLEGQPRRIEQALKSGDSVLVQVTKDPIGHKGARLTSQVTLAGRYLVFVPGGGMTGISRKLPDTERNRLKKILREVVPDSAGVIVRTAAEGASEEELRADVARLQGQWEAIEKKAKTASAPALLQGEPDMAIRVVRDIFNDDFSALVVQGDEAWSTISSYIDELAPDLAQKVSKWTGTQDVFSVHRVDEQLAKGMDRKVWLPSGGSLVIDRTEAMTVVDVNTGKFTGSGGTLEETVTRNNLEAAEEIVRQLRLRDIGGIIVIDFIDMVLESNRDLVLRRLVECLGRDRTKHQVAEVTSLGLVQMTRKRVGQGLVEAFSETCEHCHGRGFIVHTDPVEKNGRPEAGAPQAPAAEGESKRSRRKRGAAKEAAPAAQHPGVPVLPEAREAVKATLATIAAAAAHAHEHDHEHHEAAGALASAPVAPGEPVEVSAADGDAGRSAEVEPAHVEPAQVEPAHVEPVLDVLAALAASGVAREEVAEPAQGTTAGALPQDVTEPSLTEVGATEVDVTEVDVTEVADEPLELTPVSPDLFADTADDDVDGAVADEDGDARS